MMLRPAVVTALVNLAVRPDSLRSRTLTCCTAPVVPPPNDEPPMTWLRNGTRLGYGVNAELGTVPEMVSWDGQTMGPLPLPDVLVLMDMERFPTMSKARKACRRGSILVNGVEGRCITTATAGDLLETQSRIAPGFTPRGHAPFPLDVLYEDDFLAVVFKPAGVCTHPPAGGAPGGSMRTAIMHALKPPPVGTPGAMYRPHCCHRLDKPTSGLLLCAKSKPSLLGIQKAFAERTVKKRYEAIVCGHVEGDEGFIDSPVDDKAAQTEWRVLRRCRSLKLGGGHITHLSLAPRTGRTHQLRIHCADVLGCAILGDKKYGVECVGSGLFLAALELTLAHPDRPEGAPPLHVRADAPRKFGDLLSREDERWWKLSAESQSVKE